MSGTTWAKADAPFDWYIVDASQYTLGRLAVAIAETLMGKRKASYTPHLFSGDGVIVINADKVKTTGMKHERRVYTRWSGYVGGLKSMTLGELRRRDSRRLLTLAGRRMLPKNRMGRTMLKRLKVYGDDEHRHVAQQPKELVVELPKWSPEGR